MAKLKNFEVMSHKLIVLGICTMVEEIMHRTDHQAV